MDEDVLGRFKGLKCRGVGVETKIGGPDFTTRDKDTTDLDDREEGSFYHPGPN